MPQVGLQSSNSTSEKPEVVFKNLCKIFGKFFECLLAIIAAMNTDMVESSLFITHYIVMMALVFTIVVFFLTLVLGTVLEQHITNFLPILTILVLASVASVLALSIISFAIACVAFALWLCILVFVAYYNRQELYQLIS